jgi:hypothetical protein
MGVSFKHFEKWAKDRFGDENVLVRPPEIRINSIFEKDDDGHHLWCNPDGGKYKRKYGSYNCFKTLSKGSLVKLVMLVDSCDRETALLRLNGMTTVREIEKQLDQMFSAEEGLQELIDSQYKKESGLKIPNGCYLISSLGLNNKWRIKAEQYLSGRKIPIDGLYIGTDDRYKNRILIPYYDKNMNLIYYNGRAIHESKCKYLGPSKELGVGKEDVIFMAGAWPEENCLVYICEGEFNALSLKQAELNACACGGKNMGEKQALLLSPYRVVLCLDRDKAGKSGTLKMSSIISAIETAKNTTEKILYVIPPRGYNDWNEFLVKNNPAMLHHYITKNQRPLDYSGPSGTVGDFFAFSDIWR